MSLSVIQNAVKCSMKLMNTVNKKTLAAFKHNLTPIVCCGETLEQRENGETNQLVGDPDSERISRSNRATSERYRYCL